MAKNPPKEEERVQSYAYPYPHKNPEPLKQSLRDALLKWKKDQGTAKDAKK